METDISTALATLQLDPDNAQALRALKGVRPGNGSGVDPAALGRALGDSRRWHRERGDFELVVQLIDLQLTWTTDPGTRADLLHEKGRILADELLSEEPARAAFREALQNVSDHPASVDDLAQMALIADNWRPISARYLQQADAAIATDRQMAASLLGSVAEMFLKYSAEAPEGEAYLRKSLELDPKNRRASFHFERLLRGRNRPEELLSLLDERASQAQTRDERALAEVNTAELSLELGKPDQAFEHFRKALEANPIEARALRPVVATLNERKDWPELAKVLEAAARSKRGEADATLLMQLGTLQWKKLGQTAQAELNFRKVRKLEPANRLMVEFYREFHGRAEDLPQWLAVLTAAQKAEPDVERRVAMGIEMAHAAEGRPQNAEKAIDIWKGLLRLRPHLPEAVQALRRLYMRTQKWNALLDLLKEDLETLPEGAKAERIARYLEIAEIYRDRLSLDVMVVNTYLSVLQIDPAHPQALAALAQRFEAQGRWNDLIQILGRQAELASEPGQRLAIHRRIANLWVDKLGKHQNAVASLEKILEAEPGDLEARERLRDLYVRSRSWRALVELTRREAPLLAPSARRDRLAEAARISAERLGDTKEAINLWNLVLAVEPRDSDALAGLATLYDREHRWAALAEILDRQSVLAEREPAAAVALLERRGILLYEKLGAAEAAIAVFLRVQELQPQNARATRALREIYAQSGDFEALERLYAGQGNFEDLCDALTTLADRTKDVGARARMLERVAILASEKLRQPERAIKAYERILAADPSHLSAAEALVPLYRAGQKWPRLLAIYDVLLGAEKAPRGDASARLAILQDARQIAEQRMGSKGLAFQWAVRCFATAPSNEAVQGELERLAGDADEWSEIAALYAQRLESPLPGAERVVLLRRLLRIAFSRLNRPSDARRYAEGLLAEVPGDAEAYGVLEQVLTQSQSWTALTALLHERALRVDDKAERAKQLFRIAQLEEERSGEGEAATRSLGQIVELDTGTENTHRALRSLARIQEQRQDWPALIATLRRELSLRPVEDHEDILLRIAELEEQKIGDLDATFATLKGILGANPYSMVAVAGLERLRERGFARSLEMATLSLPSYQRSDNPAKLAAALEVLVAAPEGLAERRERLQKLVSLHAGPLKDARGAYRWALEIFAENPEERPNREALVRFASEVGALPELTTRLRAVADHTAEAGLRRDLLLEIADLHETKLGSASEAEKVYREILRVEPLHAGAFRALSRLFRDSERWNELRDLLQGRQAELGEPSARLELLAQIAEIDETVLDDVSHAITTFERMLELDPTDPRAYQALDRHYALRERWGDREQLLERRLRFAAAGEVSELEFRRAESRFQRFGDVEGAIEILESIVRAHPEHEAARVLLEKALTLPDHRLRAARVLEPLYEAASSFRPLAAVLELQSLHLEGSALTALLTRLAGLYESRLEDAPRALATWRRVLSAGGTHPPELGAQVLGHVERLAGKMQRWEELVDVYQEVAFRKDGADIVERADLLSRAARLYNDRLGNRRAAIDAWKMVLNLDPQNEVTARPAAEALERLYVETSNTPALIKILRSQVEWSDTVGARTELLFRIADLEENAADDTQAAVDTLRSVLEAEPANPRALDRLEGIFARSEQPRARVEILRRRIELASDVAARRGFWRQIAEIFEDGASDPQEAISANLAILDETPGDAGALEALAALYSRLERHAPRLEILERRLALAPAREGASQKEISERAEILRQIAELLGGPLASPADALVRWRELLALAPADKGALEALEHLLTADVDPTLRLSAAQALESTYEGTGRFVELATVLQIYVDTESDSQARVGTLVRLARLHEERLGDREAAFEVYTQALRDALSDARLPELLVAYERLAGAERVAQVIALYREISPDVLDESIKQRLDRRIAEGALTMGDARLAAESYRRVLERQPDDNEALAALERIYQREDDFESLYDILLRRAEIAPDVGVERKIRTQIGQLAESLGRFEESIAAYERVFELSRESTEAITALDRLYVGAERWSDLLALLERQLERRLPEATAIEIRHRLAGLQLRQLGNAEAALGHLRAVLRGDPDHAGAIAILESLLTDPSVQSTAAELLEPVYAGRQDWAALIRVGEIRLLGVEDPPQRLALTKRIARLHEEQLDDYDNALKWYGRVFEENPGERANLDQLLRLADKLNRWQDVGVLLSGYLADATDNTPAVLDVVRRAAEIFDHRLDDREEARHLYRRLFDARPDDREVASWFEAALERWSEWTELRELLDEQAGRTVDIDSRARLLRRSAAIDEEHLDDVDRALVTLREVTEIYPDDRATPTAADEIERLLRGQSRWHDLADHLEAELGRSRGDAERDAVTLRLAEVLETKTENGAAAVDRYAEILERSPAHKEAIASLERLLVLPDSRPRVATVLEPVYRHSGDWSRLATVLEAQLESVDDREDRVRLLREIADIQQRLARVDSAFDTRARAWLVDVSNADTLAEIESLALSAKLYGPYVHTLQQGAELAEDPDLKARLWAASAEVLERQLRDPGQAVEAWRQALAARPDDPESFVALERLLDAGDRVGELVEILEQHLGFAAEPDLRKGIAKRIANLYDQALKQREQAIVAWKTVSEIDDTDMDALDALGRLYLTDMAWRDLAAVLQRKIELTTDPAGLRLMRLMGARLFEEKMSEPQEALSQLRAILEFSPRDAEVLEQMDRILTDEGLHAELLDILDQRAAIETDLATRDAISVRAARLLGDELSDVAGAVERYRAILVLSPDDQDAQEALWQIARGHDFRESAAAVLEPLLRTAEDWPRLVEILELRLGVEDGAPARLATLAEIARLDEEQRGDAAAAFAAWARALAEDASAAGPRAALERLAAAAGSWDALSRVYEERLDDTFDAELQRSFAVRLGEIHEGPLADPERALSFYRRAAETPGDEVPVLAALERVLERLARPGELAEVLQRQVEMTSEPARQTDILVRLGRLRVEELDELESGLSAFREALEKSPDSAEARAALRQLLERAEARDGALDVLEPLAEGRGDYAELVALYEYRLATRDEPSERAAWLRRIAALWEDQLHQPERALVALGRALQDEPMVGQTVDALERVGAALGKPAATAATIEAAIAKADPTSARELSLRAAHLYEADGAATEAERGAAERLYRAVLDDDPENLEALTALERLYRLTRNPTALTAVLERRAEIEFDPGARHERLLEAARIHEELHDVDGALAALQKLRDAEEGDVEVLDEMARLQEQQGRLPELCEVLAERARFENDATTRAGLLARIGQLRASSLNDLDGAAEAYREALDSTPDSQALLSALETIEEKRQNWSTLQEVLFRRMGAVEGREQIPVLLRLARNAEAHLSDLDQAVGFLHQILGIDPGDAQAFLELERILRETGRWYDLVDVLGKHADVEGSANRRASELALRVAIADVWEKNLESPDSAAEALEKILALEPTQVAALLSLARLYEASGRMDDATAMLERAAAAVDGGAEAAEIHYRTAQIRRAQGAEDDELEAIYIRALEADRTHLPSLLAMEAAGRQKGDHDRVLQVLEIRLEATVGPAQRRPILIEIVKLHRDTFGNPAAATPFLQQLVALFPDDLPVSEELADAWVAAGETDQATAILERLAEQFGKARRGKDSARVLQRLGAIAEQKGDRARALDRYTAAYKLDPGHPGTLAALGRLAMAAGDIDGSRRYFRSLLLQTFDEKVAGISKAGVYLALGQIHLMAGETLKARNMFERGLESAPDNVDLKQALAAAPR